jgi:hypothetical protein
VPISPRRRRLLPVLLSALLAACGGGGGSNDSGGNGGSSSGGSSIGDPGAYAYARALDYLSVIRGSSAFDECLDSSASANPYLCLRGPRSGTALGGAVHQWMQQQLAAIPQLQYQQVQKFDFPRFLPKSYSLSVADSGGGSFSPPVFPWYYQGLTNSTGVSGAVTDVGDGSGLSLLTAGDLTGKIALLQVQLTFEAGDSKAQQALDSIAAKGAAGAIVSFNGIGNGPDNQIVLQSYDIANGLGKLPTVLVGRDDAARIKALAGQTAQLVVNAAQQTGSVTNEVAVLPGADRHNILVIGTPLNGWATSGGERGPGVGLFLYLARYLAQQAADGQTPPYTVYFVATGGHDVYASGLEQFLSCIPSSRIVAYVHLGAGLVYQGYNNNLLTGGVEKSKRMSQTRVLSISDNAPLQKLAQPPFNDPAVQPLFSLPPSVFIPGEDQIAYAKGIPTVGLSGSNAYFHTVGDDETQIVQSAMTPMAAAWQAVVDGLMQTDANTLRAANTPAQNDDSSVSCPAALNGLAALGP